MAEGVDFAWSRPGGAAIVAAGKTFVMRYLYPDGQGGKGLDASEVADYRAHGLLIGTVFESSGGRMLAGYAAGAADAHTAASQLAALGMQGTVVYFADDFDATVAQYAVLGQYLDGAASVLGKNRTGLYAGYGPIEALCGGVHADYGWQTYAWSGNHVSSKANVYQYKNGQTLNGGSVDLCRSLKDDFGAFGGITIPAGDSGTPITETPTQRGAIDMPMLYGTTMPNAPVAQKYLNVNAGLAPTKPTYMLLGGSPGTPLNAQITQDQVVASQWAKQLAPTLDNPSAVIVNASWGWADQMWDQALAPLKIDLSGLSASSSTSSASAEDVNAAADRVIAKIPTEFTAK